MRRSVGPKVRRAAWDSDVGKPQGESRSQLFFWFREGFRTCECPPCLFVAEGSSAGEWGNNHICTQKVKPKGIAEPLLLNSSLQQALLWNSRRVPGGKIGWAARVGLHVDAPLLGCMSAAVGLHPNSFSVPSLQKKRRLLSLWGSLLSGKRVNLERHVPLQRDRLRQVQDGGPAWIVFGCPLSKYFLLVFQRMARIQQLQSSQVANPGTQCWQSKKQTLRSEPWDPDRQQKPGLLKAAERLRSMLLRP